jgi:hypothetical protein
MPHKLVNGVKVELTSQEIAQRQAEETAWANGAFDRAMSSLRQRRDALLKSSDWVMMSDSPIADKTAWQTYRQELRDITDGLATVDDVNAVVFPTQTLSNETIG